MSIENSPQPRVLAREVSRAFGSTQALNQATLTVMPGEIHALVGENGAGKSTLMSILAGADRPDRGALFLDGKRYAPKSPREAQAAGVHMVHQEAMLCSHMSIAENLFLGREPAWLGLVKREQLLAQAERALAEIVTDQKRLEPTRLVSDLSPSERSLVSIARAMAQTPCRLLILDEPTASLAALDVRMLFDALRRLRSAGLSIIYISHVLEEVLEVCDSYSVLRDGVVVARGVVSGESASALVAKMAGRALEEGFPRSPREPSEMLLSARAVSGKLLPCGASLEVRHGEVVGVAGLLGSGRSELLRCLFGLDRAVSGQVEFLGHHGFTSPKERLAEGMGLLSEDRKGEGLSLDMTIEDNLTLSSLNRLGRLGFFLPRRRREVTQEWVTRLGIVCRTPDQRARELSGGNQQKVALARLLYHDVQLLLLDEPTRGVDVRSKREIYRLIDEFASRGRGVLMVSSYLPELLGVCDRVYVMRRGKLGPSHDCRKVSEHVILSEAMLG